MKLTSMHKSLLGRVIGFGTSLVLTLTAFYIFIRPDFFHLGIKAAIAIIFVFAVLQAIVQSICFLNVLSEKGTRWHLVIYISTITMVLIIVVFSIWVMNHLNYNMM